MPTTTTKETPMAITTTREQRRIENHERALAAYLEHHAAAVALISRIQVAVANHDLAPDPEAISWGTVGSMAKTRQDLQALSDWLFDEGEYAE
ncbi:MAG: hypothetical protein R6W93_15720 [Candidatus Limnocylindrales bacterium]